MGGVQRWSAAHIAWGPQPCVVVWGGGLQLAAQAFGSVSATVEQIVLLEIVPGHTSAVSQLLTETTAVLNKFGAVQ